MVRHACSMKYSHCANLTRRIWHGQPLGVSWGWAPSGFHSPNKHMYTLSYIHVVWSIHNVHTLHVDALAFGAIWGVMGVDSEYLPRNQQSNVIHGHTSM